MKDHTTHLRIPIHILVKITGVKQGRKTHDHKQVSLPVSSLTDSI